MSYMLMRDIRCPNCHRLQCKAILNGASAIQILCRCKTLLAAYERETVVVSVAASPTMTFGDLTMRGVGVMMR